MHQHSVTGWITVVQESRFRIMDEDGVGRLFVLAPNAGIGAAELAPLAAGGQKIVVRYTDGRGMVAGIAHAVEADMVDRSGT